MKAYKVLNVRTHIAGVIGKTSYDSKKHDMEMELWPVGVFIKSMAGKSYNLLEPFGNIVEVKIDYEEAEEKRGPGRPAGPRAVS